MNRVFAGTGHLVRLILRVDRIKLSLWVLGLCFLVAITPFSVRSITEAEAENQGVTPEAILAQQAQLLTTNTATVALQGPPDSIDTFGGRYAFEIGSFTFAIVAVMNILLVARHTRAEEETGRAELVRAASVGAFAPPAAVAVVAVAANAILATVTAGAFIADGVDPVGSVLFAASLALCGLAFAAVSLVWAQVFEYGRAATIAAMATLAVTFALRAVGDLALTSEGGSVGAVLNALSPIGLGQAGDPFGDRHLWPLLTLIAVTVALAGLAVVLVTRRDVGSGLIAQRPGPDRASASLGSALGLAWRLQRSTLIWWTVGLAFLGAMYGTVISTIDDFIDDNESIRDMLEQAGMVGDELRNGFVGLLLSTLALIATGGVVQSTLRPRSEEADGRAEAVLAGSVPRRSWLGSHLILAAAAAPVFMVATSLALAATDAAMVGGFTDLGPTLVAAVVRVPALWVVAAVGVLLYGARRSLAVGVWAVFALGAVIQLFGDALRLPDVVLNLSPIGHVDHLPVTDQGWTAIAVLLALTAAFTVAGLALFTRRDVG